MDHIFKSTFWMKQKTHIILGLISIVIAFTQCKPYDSNRENERMLQGGWILKDSNHKLAENDGYTRDSMTFIFRNDSIFEYVKAYNLNTSHTFRVDNYYIDIYDNDSLISKFNIIKLWNDSLILGKVNYWWLYIKEGAKN